MGCNKEVHVEILAFLGTMEEELVGREESDVEARKPRSSQRMYLEDVKMKELIDRAPFVLSNDADFSLDTFTKYSIENLPLYNVE
jgi:hypothetical protein